MSVKHIKEYYNMMADQYLEMVDNIQEYEEYAKTHVVAPEKIEELNKMLTPLKENFLTLSYVMYLLNMPNNPRKKKTYEKLKQKELNKIPYDNTQQGKLEQGDKILAQTKILYKE